MEETNKTMAATWDIAIKIWWWIMWRSILAGVVGGAILGIVLGFIMTLAGINNDTALILFGGLLGTIINIFFTKRIIGKKFKNFSLVLIKTE